MRNRNIPFFDYSYIYNSDKDEFNRIFDDVSSRGAFIMQKDLIEFENSLSLYLGVKHAIGVADGTMALLLILKSINLKPLDEVIVPSHTFVASVAAIHHVGAIPVLCDCKTDHLIDTMSVKRMINSHTKAILPVHLNGRTSEMDVIMEIAYKHNLKIVEDSCQALGSKYNNIFAGTFGDAAAFSFYPSKTLGCFGDGGAVITNDDFIAKKIRSLRDHGRNDNNDIEFFGFNSRLDNLQASILNYKLKNYDNIIEKRRKLAKIYCNRLQCIKNIILPPKPSNGGKYFDIFQNFEIEVDDREKLRIYLSNNGIGTIFPWGGKCVHQYKKLLLKSDVNYTSKISNHLILLPLNMSMCESDVEYVCQKVINYYKTQN